MFLKSKNKREQIIKKLNLSKDKDRRSSKQKRRDVEAGVDKFINTMNNFRNSRLSFKDSEVQNKTFDNFQMRKSQNIIKQDRKEQLYNTPSVKDIIFSKDQQSHSLAKQFYQLQDCQPPNQIRQPSPQKDMQINFYKPKQPEEININNIVQQHSSHRNSQLAMDGIEDQEIKLPQLNFINNSMNQSSNNNSDAIFFTSRFQQYLNNKAEESPKKQGLSQIQQKSPKKQENMVPIQKHGPQPLNLKQNGESYNQNANQEHIKQDYSRLQRHLKNNASGQSLAFSNDSSLKLSLNQSAIHDVISKKLSHQLVLQSIGTNDPHKILQQMSKKLQIKSNIRDIIQFSKQILLQKHIKKTIKTNFIDKLMINKDFQFQLKKNQIKANHHLQIVTYNHKRNIFYAWKGVFQNRIQSVLAFIQKRQITFKMILFDRRINNQVDNYYLSKVFFAFKNVIEKQKKKINQKIFKCYCRNLKRSMFYALIQGCSKSRRQRQVAQMAEDHYYFSLMSTVFSAWKQKTPKQQKFIRLSMTTKNILKQSKDNKLLQTKTFDFYQIK